MGYSWRGLFDNPGCGFKMIRVTGGAFISKADLSFRFSRSAGPGGQNVNKVNSGVTLLFDVANCSGLGADQKKRVLTKLATRVTKEGLVRVVSQKHRTQKANRNAATERLVELLADALKKKPIRRKTTISRAMKEKRLEAKKQRSSVKQQRKKIDSADYQG